MDKMSNKAITDVNPKNVNSSFMNVSTEGENTTDVWIIIVFEMTSSIGDLGVYGVKKNIISVATVSKLQDAIDFFKFGVQPTVR